MTRLIYLSDTHHGGGPQGYHRQPPYIERLPQLIAALELWMRQQGEFDLVLHGGDMVEWAEADLIAQAAGEWATLSAPVYLALGNHDLTAPDALDLWAKFGGHLFPDGEPAYTVDLDDCLLHVVPTQWGARPFFWDGGPPRACLYPDQLGELEARLAGGYHTPQLVCCHGAPMGVPAAQMGAERDFDPPPTAYFEALRDLAEAYPSLHLILSGHSHIHSLGALGGAHWLMASSFTESPFEFKDIEVTGEGLTVRTVALYYEVGWRAHYDFDAAYVQGRPCDRALTLAW
jgi:hypothetical protein